MRPEHLRKRIWINGAFQSRLLLRLVAYLLIYVAVMWYTCFVFELLPGLVDGSYLSRGIGGLFLDSLARQKPFLVAICLTLPAALYDLLKFSHRIAGPLFRCQKVMEAMASGQVVQEFKPRDGDHMPEFFQAFNSLIKQSNARLEAGMNGQPGDPDRRALNDEPSPQTQNHEAQAELKASA
jgi:hypothetical protein